MEQLKVHDTNVATRYIYMHGATKGS